MTLTNYHDKSYREARDENAIRAPKALLYGLRKTVQYFMTKLSNIHKLKGFRYVKEAFFGEAKGRNWYRGHYVFPGKDDIMSRFQKGKQLSCFIIEGQPGAVHVAYKLPNHQTTNNDEFGYLSFDINSVDWQQKIMGVHFSQFSLREGASIGNKQVKNVCSNALMPPYILEVY